MEIQLHPHAIDRMIERGANHLEVIETIEHGEWFPVKFNRTGFRRNFMMDVEWKGKLYHNKQIEAIAVEEEDRWIILTVIVRYF